MFPMSRPRRLTPRGARLPRRQWEFPVASSRESHRRLRNGQGFEGLKATDPIAA
jgi:hypothetical protein